MIKWDINVIDILAFIIAAGGLYLSFRRTPVEIKKLQSETGMSDADSAASYSEAAKNYAEQVVELQKRLLKVETDYNVLKLQVAELQKYKEWAMRLSYQVRALGHVPVPFDPISNSENTIPNKKDEEKK